MIKKKDLTELVEYTVACARTGRATASIGGMLTSAEQERLTEIYSRLKSEEEVKKESPTIVQIYSKTGRKGKISLSDAIDWFIKEYPKESLPLQKKMKEEKPCRKKNMLGYGLKPQKDLSDDFYINIITEITNIPKDQASIFYYGLLKPQLEKLEETKGLLETEIK